ncbi:platelet glycoprotein Ib alpha chain-like [Rhinatrema bivittatum]|uniref:platelet glycoprotein Ib alpha chain-like n=1 Tax=Rhinatrema bivittatum TaxID=194408 RepID=UPI00112A69D2|nr:platelet glycoprotein Ib alpha chain-like [Rhinatrema bivittatum]
MPLLTHLDLSENNLTTLTNETFKSLSSLGKLIISKNKITTLPNGTFAGLNKVSELNLEMNNLQSLEPGIFSSLPALKTLNLQKNQLESVPEGIFDSLAKLSTLSLSDNPWLCDCHLHYLHNWISINRKKLKSSTKVQCENPDHLKGKTITSVTKDQLICLTTLSVSTSKALTTGKSTTTITTSVVTTLLTSIAHSTFITTTRTPTTELITTTEMPTTHHLTILIPTISQIRTTIMPTTREISTIIITAPLVTSTLTPTTFQVTSTAIPTTSPVTTTVNPTFQVTTIEIPTSQTTTTIIQTFQVTTRAKSTTSQVTTTAIPTTPQITTTIILTPETITIAIPTSMNTLTEAILSTIFDLNNFVSTMETFTTVHSTVFRSTVPSTTGHAKTSSGLPPFETTGEISLWPSTSHPAPAHGLFKTSVATTTYGLEVSTSFVTSQPSAISVTSKILSAESTHWQPTTLTTVQTNIDEYTPYLSVSSPSQSRAWMFPLGINLHYCQLFLISYMSMLLVEICCAAFLFKFAYTLYKAMQHEEMPTEPAKLLNIHSRLEKL